jgi:hypothetical protein
MRWTGHVACMGAEEYVKIWLENLKINSEDVGVDGRIILKRILRE